MTRKTIFIALCLFLTLGAMGQKLTVRGSTEGNFTYLIHTKNGGAIVLDKYGNVSLNRKAQFGRIDYYDRFAMSEKEGKLKSVGNIEIDYYSGAYGSYRAGKVKQIGNLKIDYYHSAHGSHCENKISQIGSLKLDYYHGAYGSGAENKLKSIGSVTIKYSSGFGGDAPGGCIESVGSHKLEYFSSFDIHGHEGELKSRREVFTAGRIEFIIFDRRR